MKFNLSDFWWPHSIKNFGFATDYKQPNGHPISDDMTQPSWKCFTCSLHLSWSTRVWRWTLWQGYGCWSLYFNVKNWLNRVVSVFYWTLHPSPCNLRLRLEIIPNLTISLKTLYQLTIFRIKHISYQLSDLKKPTLSYSIFRKVTFYVPIFVPRTI